MGNGIIFEDENIQGFYIEEVYEFAYKVLDEFIIDNKSLEFNPIQIAFACVFLTREYYRLNNEIINYLDIFYNLEFTFYRECVIDMKR